LSKFLSFILRSLGLCHESRCNASLQVDLEPNGRLRVIIELTGSASEGTHWIFIQHCEPHDPYVVGAELCRLSPIDAYTVALKPIHEKISY